MMPKRGKDTLQSQAGHAFLSTGESSAVRKPPTADAERVAKAKEDWQAIAEASEAPERHAKQSDMLRGPPRKAAICRATSPTEAKAKQSTCRWALPSKAKPKDRREGGEIPGSKSKVWITTAKLRKAMQRKSRHPLIAVASHEKCDSTAYSGACGCTSRGETHQEWHRNAHWHTPRTLLGIPRA